MFVYRVNVIQIVVLESDIPSTRWRCIFFPFWLTLTYRVNSDLNKPCLVPLNCHLKGHQTECTFAFIALITEPASVTKIRIPSLLVLVQQPFRVVDSQCLHSKQTRHDKISVIHLYLGHDLSSLLWRVHLYLFFFRKEADINIYYDSTLKFNDFYNISAVNIHFRWRKKVMM